MRNYNERFIYILILLFIATDAWTENAQPVIRPTVKTPFPIYCLSWNKDASSFSYAEQGNIVIRKTSDYSVSKTIETSADEIFAVKYASSITQKNVYDRIVSVSTDNCLQGHVLPDNIQITFNDVSYYRRPTSLAINPTGDYIATGMADGSIELFMWYFTTNTFTRRTPLQTVGRYVDSVAFSRNNSYLAAATDTNTVFIFDFNSGIAVHTIPYNSDLKIGIEFTADSKAIITAIDENNLGIYNFDGDLITSMKIKDSIRNFQMSKDGKHIYVLTKKNHIRLYNTSNGKELGYITPFNNTEITSYAISPESDNILIGHRDGSIYLAKIRNVLLDPKAKEPKYTQGNDKKGATNLKDVQKTQEIIVDASVIRSLNQAFAYGAELEGGYLNYQLIRPFYFGGKMSASFTFKDESYPYNYEIGGKPINPILHIITLSTPMGFIILPIGEVELYAEITPGFSLNTIWDGEFGNNFVRSGIYPAFFTDFGVGIGWRRFNATVIGEYSFLTGFSFKATVGYLFDLKPRRRRAKI